MKTWLKFASALLFATAGMASAAHAQQGCKASTNSCTQFYKSCEQICRNRGNGESCVARYCSTSLTSCKANGVWKSVSAGNACWTTTNRS